MNPFETRIRQREGVAVLELRGQLDGKADLAMDAAYADAVGAGTTAVLLDFGHVDFINSTGIALIVGLLGKARQQQLPVLVCGLSDHYQHIFEITRLADFMQFFADEEAAIGGVEPAV